MGSKQLGFGDFEQATAKKCTRRERFLGEMEKVVPWKALLDLIGSYYPKTQGPLEVCPSSPGGLPAATFFSQDYASHPWPRRYKTLLPQPI